MTSISTMFVSAVQTSLDPLLKVSGGEVNLGNKTVYNNVLQTTKKEQVFQ